MKTRLTAGRIIDELRRIYHWDADVAVDALRVWNAISRNCRCFDSGRTRHDAWATRQRRLWDIARDRSVDESVTALWRDRFNVEDRVGIGGE